MEKGSGRGNGRSVRERERERGERFCSDSPKVQ